MRLIWLLGYWYFDIFFCEVTAQIFCPFFSCVICLFITFWILVIFGYMSFKGFSDSSVGKESACNAGDPGSNSWVRKLLWRRDRLPSPLYLGFPGGSAGKESTCHAGDLGSIPGLGRSPGEGKGYPLQYSGLENSMDCIVRGVTKGQTWLSDFHFHFNFPFMNFKYILPLCGFPSHSLFVVFFSRFLEKIA